MRALTDFGLLTLVGLIGAACAGSIQNDETNTILSRFSDKALSRDFRIVFHLEEDVVVCGGEGDYYVGQVEMNERVRFLDENQRVQLRDD